MPTSSLIQDVRYYQAISNPDTLTWCKRCTESGPLAVRPCPTCRAWYFSDQPTPEAIAAAIETLGVCSDCRRARPIAASYGSNDTNLALCSECDAKALAIWAAS